MSRHIIKYSNRRLYDAVQRRAITLVELSDLVAAGESVTVELKGTGEDITAVTLIQSFLERLRRRPGRTDGSEARNRLLGAVRRALEREADRGEDREPDAAELKPGVGLPD